MDVVLWLYIAAGVRSESMPTTRVPPAAPVDCFDSLTADEHPALRRATARTAATTRTSRVRGRGRLMGWISLSGGRAQGGTTSDRRVGDRHGGDEPPRVVPRGGAEDRARGTGLDDPAGLQHRHPV